MFIRLKPYKQRKPIQQIIDDITDKSSYITGINTYLSTIPLINLQVGTQARALYQYALTSTDQDTIDKYSQDMSKKISQLSGFTQVISDLEIKQPQLKIDILRDRASDLNISASKIERLLLHAYSNQRVSTIKTPIDHYNVVMETEPKYYRNPETLSKLYVRSETNKLVPIKEIITMREDVGPLSVNHFNGIPSATIWFNLKDIPLGDAIDQVEKIAKDVLPSNVNGMIQGTADVFQQSFADLTALFILTIFIIYVVLGILYESFIHPITVMSTLPPATFGGLFTLYLFGETLSLYSFVGLIMLIGIVMKNGIMMVDFANVSVKEEKKNAYDAIIEAALTRFRPILMTSIATFMGALPIAIGIGGASAQGRRPLGMVVVGGLLVSQILTLFLTPVIYYYLEKLREFLEKIFHKEKTSA